MIEQWMLWVAGAIVLKILGALGWIIKYLANHFKTMSKDITEIKAEQVRQGEALKNIEGRMSAINGI